MALPSQDGEGVSFVQRHAAEGLPCGSRLRAAPFLIARSTETRALSKETEGLPAGRRLSARAQRLAKAVSD